VSPATHTPRIAILIVAHAHPELLDRLVSGLVKDFDVYLHVDRASRMDLSHFSWASSVKRVRSRRTYWGAFAVTQAIVDLLRLAYARGYDRYVLISGQDVPLVSNREIIDYFATHPELDFIQSMPLPSPRLNGGIERITRVYWHAPYRHSGLKRMLYNLVEYAFEAGYRTVLQSKIIVGKFYWGETWFSLRHDTLKGIFAYLDEQPEFTRLFAGSRLGEELFLQTLVRRISPAATLAPDTTTYVDWVTGPEKPRVLDESDIPRLQASSHLFARKVHPVKSATLLTAMGRNPL